ncbi:MAG: hypothetical protein QW112_01660 [Candidatus Micrarchaeia archaeon]
MSELTYEELRRIQSKEREPGLSRLPEDFYSLVRELLSKYREKGDTKERREYENILKILRYIHIRRMEKILSASINSLNGVEPPPGMLKEELETYRKITDIIKHDKDVFEKNLYSGFSDSNTHEIFSQETINLHFKHSGAQIEDAKKHESHNECLLVKIVKDIDEFVGLDGKIYGPYKAGTEVVLPAREVETLLKVKLIEKKAEII